MYLGRYIINWQKYSENIVGIYIFLCKLFIAKKAFFFNSVKLNLVVNKNYVVI